MTNLNFEKNLLHQTQAVQNAVRVFDGLETTQVIDTEKQYANPILNQYSMNYGRNIRLSREENGVTEWQINPNSNIIDTMMETWTGKTYTYTKTIFELNKLYWIFKFVIIVPTIAIKAGTINFLKSDSSREHFREQYWKTLKLHIVESKKSKNKKDFMPPAVSSFVNAGNYEKGCIQLMIINQGMINSDTMSKKYDRSFFDKYDTPFEWIAMTKPFVIIDEPHKFKTSNKTWDNIEKFKAQYILRYGATFDKYENLVHMLTSVDSFNRNLVKWVEGHITDFEEWKNDYIRLVNLDGIEATFETSIWKNKKQTSKLKIKDNLKRIHAKVDDLFIENLNKTELVLSNGLSMRKWDKINPYSYSETLQETMIKKAIKEHFKLEKKYLTRDIKIKPLTLFFIDNIQEYRNEDWSMKSLFEQLVKAEVEELIKEEENEYYKQYLQQTLDDISKTHAGYFSEDKSKKDEAIEKEIDEILHDKESMLDLNNTRRFIFSKWTLREGWDNPNVFGICKLRSSGSENSKLQEVGRGLRLPVNEFWNRVKDEQFYLKYFVDFTESDFVEKLRDEINEKSKSYDIQETPSKLEDWMIKKICEKYDVTEDDLLSQLDNSNIINRKNEFINDWFEYIKKEFPKIFEWTLAKNKVKLSTDTKQKVTIRKEKYSELKDLWENLNKKVVLKYDVNWEDDFKKIFDSFLTDYKDIFEKTWIQNKIQKIKIKNTDVVVEESVVLTTEINSISTIKYSDFLKKLSKELKINIKTLHTCFSQSDIDINNYLWESTIRLIKEKFNNYLMYQTFSNLNISYKWIDASIHPTKLTNSQGEVLQNIWSSDIWVLNSNDNVATNYLFEELFYDSELEKENIKTNLKEVVVFTKIPKNSIKIPVAWWKSYSPDFAYVLHFENNEKKLYLVVETKNTSEEQLRNEEKIKIKHAEQFFWDTVEIKFKTQFNTNNMIDIIWQISWK